jgi:predicted HicB family RNase H-like nuclease
LPGLSAFGDTPEEAVAEAKIAGEGFIKVFKEDGCEMPTPRKLSVYSGQTRLRLSKSLHLVLSQEAKSEGISLNSYIVQLLSERHIAHKTDEKLETIQNILFGVIMGQTKAESDMDTSHVLFKEFKIDDLEERKS